MTILKLLKKILQIIVNLLFITQIILMILGFFTAAYWFFSLIGSNIFSFAEPITNPIIDFIKLFYTPSKNGEFIDASLLIFDIIAIFVVLGINKLKLFIYELYDEIDILISKLKQIEEDNFNKKLKKETDANILKLCNTALVVDIELKDSLAKKSKKSVISRDVKPIEMYTSKILENTLQNLKNCTFAKDNKNLIIFLDNFNKIDNIIYFIEQAISNIRKELKKDCWELKYYIAVEVYDNKTDFKKIVYPALKKLLKLKLSNVITCYGSFNLRYKLKLEPLYYILMLNGKYAIDGGTDIYILVKKD